MQMGFSPGILRDAGVRAGRRGPALKRKSLDWELFFGALKPLLPRMNTGAPTKSNCADKMRTTRPKET
jgi:hypothetical protein